MITVGIAVIVLVFWIMIAAMCNGASQAQAFWAWFILLGIIGIVAIVLYYTWNIVLIP